MSVELAQKFAESAKLDNVIKRMLKGLFAAMSAADSELDNKEVIETMDKVIDDAVDIYMEGMHIVMSDTYSDEELEQLIAFNNTPVGRKVIEYRELLEFKGNKLMEKAIEASLRKNEGNP